jgi:glutamate synthase domain-containing protein 3
MEYSVSSTDRAVGATLAGQIALGRQRIPSGGYLIQLTGYAGQGLGFACVEGMRIELTGFANDAVGEVMSGGTLVVKAPRSILAPQRHELSTCGNALGYGATGGSLFIEGRAGQRVGVRNSGATIVVEGAGKYAFEYMTGGLGVVLGPVGTVVASGMTGGVLYLLKSKDLDEKVHDDARIEELSDADAEALRALIEAHATETGSARARSLLSEWASSRVEFAKVLPK